MLSEIDIGQNYQNMFFFSSAVCSGVGVKEVLCARIHTVSGKNQIFLFMSFLVKEEMQKTDHGKLI